METGTKVIIGVGIGLFIITAGVVTFILINKNKKTQKQQFQSPVPQQKEQAPLKLSKAEQKFQLKLAKAKSGISTDWGAIAQGLGGAIGGVAGAFKKKGSEDSFDGDYSNIESDLLQNIF